MTANSRPTPTIHGEPETARTETAYGTRRCFVSRSARFKLGCAQISQTAAPNAWRILKLKLSALLVLAVNTAARTVAALGCLHTLRSRAEPALNSNERRFAGFSAIFALTRLLSARLNPTIKGLKTRLNSLTARR